MVMIMIMVWSGPNFRTKFKYVLPGLTCLYMSVILQCFITLKAPDALVNVTLNMAKPSYVLFILKSHSPAFYFKAVCASTPRKYLQAQGIQILSS